MIFWVRIKWKINFNRQIARKCYMWHMSLHYYHLIHDRWSLPSVQRALHPFQGWGLATVQWAPHPSWEMRFTQCANSPSSILRMRFSQCAVGHSSLLRDEVYPVCNQPFIPVRWSLQVCNLLRMRFAYCAMGPSSLLRDKGLASAQRAPHPS